MARIVPEPRRALLARLLEAPIDAFVWPDWLFRGTYNGTAITKGCAWKSQSGTYDYCEKMPCVLWIADEIRQIKDRVRGNIAWRFGTAHGFSYQWCQDHAPSDEEIRRWLRREQ